MLAEKTDFQCVSPVSLWGNHDSSQSLFNAVVTQTLDSRGQDAESAPLMQLSENCNSNKPVKK